MGARKPGDLQAQGPKADAEEKKKQAAEVANTKEEAAEQAKAAAEANAEEEKKKAAENATKEKEEGETTNIVSTLPEKQTTEASEQPKQAGAYASTEVQELLASLALAEPRISQTFLYDEKGSALYEKIVEQKEYYLVEAESALVARHMGEIAIPAAGVPPAGAARAVKEQLIVELGAGAGHRTHPLVKAMAVHSASTIYSPTDISPSALEENRHYFDTTCGATDGLRFEQLVGSHEVTMQAVAKMQHGSGETVKTFLFMGSSMGNYFDSEIVGLFRLIMGVMGPHDRLLVGVDRCHGPHKPPHVIQEAYNDVAGYTAAFTLNALSHANRVAGLNFNEAQWRHEAVYDKASCSIITHVVAQEDVEVRAASGTLQRTFRMGERIFMEQSRKFDEASTEALAAKAGMVLSRSWSDNTYLLVELRALAAM